MINVINLNRIKNPEDIFNLVMAYADEAGKDRWASLNSVLNPSHVTVVFYNDDVPVGYVHGWLNNDGHLFIHHYYMAHMIKRRRAAFDAAISEMIDTYNIKITRVTGQTKLNPRLMRFYGFKPTETVYVKEVD